MVTPNSPDISNLSVEVVWDISGTSPVIELTNNSTGTNLDLVSYAFLIKSPSQTVIHDGDIATPDIDGIWTDFTFYSTSPNLSPQPTNYIVAPWPRPFNQIEWSGANYTIEIFAKDSVGNIFSYVVGQPICRPAGNINTTITTYGLGLVNITMNCNNANAFFEDTTNSSYKGLTGTQESSILKVLYPDDETDTAPQPFVITSFASAIVPITYDSQNYEFVYSGVYLYDFGNSSFVRIKYYRKQRFTVNCNIDLCPLVCEYTKLLSQFESGSCQDATMTQDKLILINGKMNLALIAKSQPLCGIDLPALIEEIKVIGGFDCDCCSPSGIAPFNSTNIGDFNFQVISGGGDISGNVNVVGNNIQFILYDKSYIFKICNDAPTAAFTVTPSLTGFTKTYCLNVNLTTLATDLANTISSSVDLINLWSFLSGQATMLVVDGKCVFDSPLSCDYTYTLEGVPTNTTYAILTSFVISGVPTFPNFAFNETNLAALQTYLNSLSAGTFSISSGVSGEVIIESDSNTVDLGSMFYSVASNNYQASQSKICGSFVPLQPSYVSQKIIDYVCSLDDSQVKTSQSYDICYIDPTTNTQKTETVASGLALSVFIESLIARGCDTNDYIITLKPINCANIQNTFPLSISSLQSNDSIYGTKAGSCARIYPVELGTRMLQLGAYDPVFLAEFCNLVDLCRGGFSCEPYSVFNLSVSENSPADNLQDIIVTFTHPSAVSNTLRYARIDNTSTPTYTTITGILPGASPYTINNVAVGQYAVTLTPIYSDGRSCPEVVRMTDPCEGITAFNVTKSAESLHFYVGYTASSDLVRLVVILPNGGISTTTYTNGDPIVYNPPLVSGDPLTGNYSFTLIPVCNSSTNFIGQSTAPIILPVTPPNNSSLVNNSGGALTDIALTSYNGSGTALVFISASVAGSGGSTSYYVSQGFYNSFVITFNTGTAATATLTSSAGAVTGVIAGSVITFSNVTVGGGIGMSITIT